MTMGSFRVFPNFTHTIVLIVLFLQGIVCPNTGFRFSSTAQWTSSSNVWPSATVTTSVSPFYLQIPTNPTDTTAACTTNCVQRSGSFWHNNTFDISAGFHTSFSFQVTGNYGTNGAGNGFLFALQPVDKTVVSVAIDSVGLVDLSSALGIGLSYNQFASPVLRSFVTSPLVDPGINVPLPQLSWNDSNVHTLAFRYSVLTSPPSLSIYLDSSFITSVNVNLSSLFNNQRVYPGFTGSINANVVRQTNLILNGANPLEPATWEFYSHSNQDKLYLSCPQVLSVVIGNDTLSVNLVAADFVGISPFVAGSAPASARPDFNRNFLPGDVVGFTAQRAAAVLQGCMADLRDITTGLSINLAGRWRCTTGVAFPTNFTLSSFNEASLPLAFVVNTNQANLNQYRIISNINPGVERIWSGNGTLNAVCRVVVPRYCSVFSQSFCLPTEFCDFATNLCKCSRPYFGTNCVSIETANVSSISPTLTLENRGIVVNVNGINFFNNSQISCYLNGLAIPTVFVSSSLLQCQVPPQSQGVFQLTVKILNAGNFSSPFPLIFYPSFNVSRITPSFGNTAGGDVVDVTGSGFSPSFSYFCKVDQDFIPAVFVNSSLLRCTTLPHSSGLFFFQITINSQDFVSSSNSFTFIDPLLSEYCRSYKSLKNGQEFPFVGSDKQVSIYFPQNVAFSQGVISSTSVYVPTQAVDNDFCCAPLVGNDASRCGLFFSPGGLQNATIVLNRPAHINEIVTSWGNPCNYMPPSYDIHFWNTQTLQWEFIQTRFTQKNSTCTTVPGDSGPVAFCVDFLNKEVETNKFSISFSHTSSALLYEFAIQGVFLDDPFYFVPSSTWQTPPDVVVSTFVTLPPLQLNLLTFNKQVVSSPNVTVTLQLLSATGNDVSSLLNVSSLTQQFVGSFFDSLVLKNPSLGSYSLVLSSPFMQTEVLDFQIVPGAPSRLTIQTPSLTKRADSQVTLSYQLCVTDQLNNPVSSSQFTISLNQSGLNPDTTSFVISGCSSISFVLNSPKSGSYQLSFGNPSLGSVSSQLTILSGTPKQLTYTGSKLVNNRDNITAQFEITDGAGNPVSSDGLVNGTITLVSISPTPTRSNEGESLPILNGVASFQLYLFGDYGANYTLTFSISSQTLSFTETVVIRVVRCDEIYLGSVPSETDKTTCQCAAGFQADISVAPFLPCSPCPANFFKEKAGSQACLPCPVGIQQTFNNSIGQTFCVCDQKHVQDSSSGECVPCPEGALCGNNVIVGNQQGYWRSPQNNFYRCSLSRQLSSEDTEASQEACPSSLLGSFQCGDAYSGDRCLHCASSFGNNGPFCRKCPAAGSDWVVVLICTAIVFGMAVFIIVQGTSKNFKEATSFRILLSHTQMLGIISVLATWASPFREYLSIAAMALWIRTRTLYFDCLFGNGSFYSIFAGYMLFPIFLLLGIAFAFFLVYLLGRIRGTNTQSGVERLVGKCLLTIVVVYGFMYPAITVKVLEVFDCRIKIDDKNYLAADTSVECGTEEYILYAVWAAAMLIIFCVGLPLVFLLLLWRNRTKKSEIWQTFLRHFFEGYKSNRYYWEILVFFRKFAMVVCIVVFSNDLVNGVYSLIYVIQGALLIHLIFHPHVSGRQHRLELVSIASVLVTLFIGLYLLEAKKDDKVSYGLSILLLLLHILALIYFIFFIVRGLVRHHAETFWRKISRTWKKAPNALKKNRAKVEKVGEFFQEVAESSEDKRNLLFAGVDRWWKNAPNYKRKRLITLVRRLNSVKTLQSPSLQTPSEQNLLE